MENVVLTLASYLTEYFIKGLKGDAVSERYLRPILVGPPHNVLNSLFETLTNRGTTDWTVTAQVTVTVLLVQEIPESSTTSVFSQRCNWDYAVTVRNSRQLVVMIVDPAVWDNRPESLANTTETIGSIANEKPQSLIKTPPWKFIIETVVNHSGLAARTCRKGLIHTLSDCQELDPPTRAKAPWEIADDLLVNPISGNSVLAALGLPSLGTLIQVNDEVIERGYKAVGRLGICFSKLGLTEGIEQLKSTNIASNASNAPLLLSAFDDMGSHIKTKAPSGATFNRAPIWYFRPGSNVSGWWDLISLEILEKALDEVLGPQQQDKLQLVCRNAIHIPKDDEPYVVAEERVELFARTRGGNLISNPSFYRKQNRTPTNLTGMIDDPTVCIDNAPPTHEKPIKYGVSADNAKPDQIDVVVLSQLQSHGFALVNEAKRFTFPGRSSSPQKWEQQVHLQRSGNSVTRIFCSSQVRNIELLQDSSLTTALAVTQDQFFVDTTIPFEDDAVIRVLLKDINAQLLAEWEIHCDVEDANEFARNRFEALVIAHQTRSSVPPTQVIESGALHLERQYISSSDSWKPILACWATGVATIPLSLDWNNPRLGNAFPSVDPRPDLSSLTPPPGLIAAREEIRKYLERQQRPIGEIALEQIAAQVNVYVQEYRIWMVASPEKACWFDTIVLHDTEENPQAGKVIPTHEPLAVLLSPLHPLRIGWQTIAQEYLTTALTNRCPIAGLLDASSCPDSMAVYLMQGGTKPVARAFFSMPCDNPYWGLMWNTKYLTGGKGVLERLYELGLQSRGIASGFTSAQVVSSLSEVCRLIPGRSILRIGIVGTPTTSNGCGEGVIAWCLEQYDEEVLNVLSPFYVDVYDMRRSKQPSPERLSSLSEETDERVKWFKVDNLSKSTGLDLVLLDDLASSESATSNVETEIHNPVGQAALVRTRIREDFQNANILKELRVGSRVTYSDGLAGELEQTIAALEYLSLKEGGVSQYEFRPNQSAVGSRLEQSSFVAVTSDQIDPACIVRGAMGQHGYLWDYELPSILEGKEDNTGYYLIANPLDAMRDAVQNSISLVTSSPLNPSELLSEISRRGIPILKRFAAGGMQSRGELGLLIAVRLLQDAFRSTATSPRIAVYDNGCINFILPVDPYEQIFVQLIKSVHTTPSLKRPDLLIFSLQVEPSVVTIQITPVEVKFRNSKMGDVDLEAALQQAQNFGDLLARLWENRHQLPLWQICTDALLNQLLDFGFRIYADQSIHKQDAKTWSSLHASVLQAVYEGRAVVDVRKEGRLVVLDRSTNSEVKDIDKDGIADTLILSFTDADNLLADRALPKTVEDGVKLLGFSIPSCAPTPVTSPQIAQKLVPSVQSGISQVVSTPQGDQLPSSAGTVTPEIRATVSRAFEGFVGNEAAIKRITNDLLRALMENPPHLPKNYLITGQPSTGKTELARRISRALELPFIRLDGRGLNTRERLFDLINGELQQQNLRPTQVATQAGLPVIQYPPLIVFIDEVHLVQRSVQESLLTMLEAADRTVTLSKQVARVDKATFIFATTRASDLDAAFRSRCSEVQLREYTVSQVAKIVASRLQRAWPDAIYEKIAVLGRGVPRIAIELAQELITEITVSEHSTNDISPHLEEVRKARELDEQGLTRLDLTYLSVLSREGKPLGEQPILNMIGSVDRDRIVNEIEPYLIHLGFIRLGARGREITPKGRAYVLKKRNYEEE